MQGGYPDASQAESMSFAREVVPFTWQVVVADLAGANAELRRLASRVHTLFPGAASVLVTGYGGVRLLDKAGEALALDDLPLDLAGQLAEFFGVGVYLLPGAGRAGCRIERAYSRR